MEQEDRFDDFCSVCLDRGFLLCCEGCSAAFHLSCVNLSAVPEGEWQCPACVAAAEWDRYGDALLSGRGRRRAEARGALRGGRGSGRADRSGGGRADSERSADKEEEQMGLKAQPQASIGSGDACPSADEREEAEHRSGGAAPVKALGTGVRRPRELQPTTTSRTVEYKPGSLPPHWWCEERRTSRHRYRVFHGPGGVSAPSRLIAWRRHTGGSEVEAAAAMAAAVAEVAEAAGAAGAAESAGVIVAERFVASVSAASRCVSAQSLRAASDSDETSDARQAELLARETDSVASGSGNASSAQTCAASATGAEAAAEGAEPSLAAAAIPSRHAAKRRRADEDAPRPASRSGGVRRAHRTLAGRD
uniref:PHD-type domain-containing protein n=1 Tax=Chrysotila carterae TaxID=13221 RepID=A0A7S4FA24_CHRCT